MLIKSKTCGCGKELNPSEHYYMGVEEVCRRCYIDFLYEVEQQEQPQGGDCIGWMMIASVVFWLGFCGWLIWG